MGNERFATVSTAFSGVELHLQHMTAGEELGRPFRYELELLCDKNDLDLDKQLGETITVTVETRDGDRFFNGLVSQISFAGMQDHKSRYLATVRPALWFLTYSSNNRVFQTKTVPDILDEIFQEYGLSHRASLNETYRKRDYCVQYGETDFDFVSRLMEEEGIYYFFEHKDGKHDLILADSSNAHAAISGYEQVKFFPPSEGQREEDHISDWELFHRVETQKFTVGSYNYEKPKDTLSADTSIEKDHGQKGKEQYEYGQLFPQAKDGERLSEVRAQEQLANYAVATGGGNVRGLSCGNLFELLNCPREDQNMSYLVIGATYELENSAIETGTDRGEASFTCHFSAIDEKTPFRPARSIAKALVRGPQTAVVVGPDGEEIWTDKYARVKVQFHWDREGEKNEKSSCWVRVAHALAGQKWGFISIPRIGQEVIVDFLEGDPDQPIITGAVYNDDNMPPYGLPDNKTQSGVKTRSSLKGSAKNFNELRFEDKIDAEEVFFHAEKDFNRVVKNNDTLKVGLETKDKGDQTIEIQNNRTVTLKEGDDSLEIKKGSQKVKAKQKINIEAGDELHIKVGQSTLTMKKNGDITLKGMKLQFTANNSVTIKGAAKVEVKGAQVKITGDAKTDVKGAMTKVEGSGVLDLKGGGMAKLKGGVTMIG